MNRKIYLQLTPFFPSKYNYAGTYIVDQVEALIKEETYEVVVVKVVGIYSRETSYISAEGISVLIFRILQLPSGILPGLFNALNARRLAALLKANEIELKKITIIHSHVTFPCGNLAVNFQNKYTPQSKSIIQHHGFDVFGLNGGVLKKVNRHHAYLINQGVVTCNRADLNVGVSKKTLRCLNSHEKLKLKNSYVLYNGIDPSKFYPMEGLKDANYFVIGCVANFWPLKDQLTLIKSIETLVIKGVSDIRVKFVGTGAKRALCEQYVQDNQLGKYFTFIDFLKREQLNEFYNGLHLFVLPSFYEALGCVYLEASACKVPFVAVKGQGIEELIKDELHDKWLIDKSDYLRLAQIIEGYLHNDLDCKTEYPLNQNVQIDSLISSFLKEIDKA